jgi:hypothetical protein
MVKLLDIYSDYLICSTSQTSATVVSRLLDNEVSHDKFSRFLSCELLDSKKLWRDIKALVREHENENGFLVFDDSIIEKAYTDCSDLICWYWDHSQNRNVKGINLLSAFYVSEKTVGAVELRVPVQFELVKKTLHYCVIKTRKEMQKSPKTKNEMLREMIVQSLANQLKFKYILADSWFSSAENMTFIADKKKFFIFDLPQSRTAILAQGVPNKPDKKGEWTNINELDIPNNTPVVVWLKGIDFPVLITKQVFKEEDNKVAGVRFLVSNDLSLTNELFSTIYKKRWSVEEYHKSLKQNVSIAKSPTRTITTQSNHLYCAIWAYVKLEKIKFKTKLNHFNIKAKIYIKALKAAYLELATINAKITAA